MNDKMPEKAIVEISTDPNTHCMRGKYDFMEYDEDAVVISNQAMGEEMPERPIFDVSTDPNTHCMEGKYEFLEYDEDADVSLGIGVFHVKRLHASFYMPSFANPNIDPFPALEEVTMDEGDVLICSPMKTGTHWSYEILKMLKAGKAEYTKLPKEAEWIEVSPYDRVKSWCPAGTRVLNTHLPLSKLPPNFRRRDTKVIITMRNLKDTAVSAYHHLLTPMLRRYPDTDKKQFWRTILRQILYSHKVFFGNHLDLYREFWLENRHDPNVLIVFFEDLKRDTKNQIKRIGDHIGAAYTDDLVDEIADAVNISKMKEGKKGSEENLQKQGGPKVNIYRKGEIGDWKNMFTVAQNEEFDKVINEWNKDLQIPFILE